MSHSLVSCSVAVLLTAHKVSGIPALHQLLNSFFYSLLTRSQVHQPLISCSTAISAIEAALLKAHQVLGIPATTAVLVTAVLLCNSSPGLRCLSHSSPVLRLTRLATTHETLHSCLLTAHQVSGITATKQLFCSCPMFTSILLRFEYSKFEHKIQWFT